MAKLFENASIATTRQFCGVLLIKMFFPYRADAGERDKHQRHDKQRKTPKIRPPLSDLESALFTIRFGSTISNATKET